MGLGENMKAAREAAKKTQQQVADELGVTKGAVSQWENDGTVPELEFFKAFCVFTKASADEVLLDRRPDPLLRQLMMLYGELSTDGRDTLLGNANRIHAQERPGPSTSDPFSGRLPPTKPKPKPGIERRAKSRS